MVYRDLTPITLAGAFLGLGCSEPRRWSRWERRRGQDSIYGARSTRRIQPRHRAVVRPRALLAPGTGPGGCAVHAKATGAHGVEHPSPAPIGTVCRKL